MSDIDAEIEQLQAEIGEQFAGLPEADCAMSAHLDLACDLERLAYVHCRIQDCGVASDTLSIAASQIVLAMTLHANVVATTRDAGEDTATVNTPIWYKTYNDALELAYLGSDLALFGSIVWMCPEVYRPTAPQDIAEEGEISVVKGRLFFQGKHAELERVEETVGAFLSIIRGDEEAFHSKMEFHLAWAAEQETTEYARFPTFLAKVAMQYAPSFNLPTDDARIAWGLLE